MSLSIQTNVASLEAQNFVNINTNFQSNTVEQLSSGYRINNSGDDAAGLATANQYAGTIATLTQGVLNAGNSGSTLQIADGGLSNITTILNRLQTLATESASSTFAGNRATVNAEYQGLLTEINRQAASIGLSSAGGVASANNTNLTTYVGGADNQADSQVNVDLSGANNTVDSKGLGIAATSVAGGGTELTGNTVNLNNTAVTFLSNSVSNVAATQAFNFNIATATGNTAVAITVTGTAAAVVGAGGITGANAVTQLNTALATYGVTASIANDGDLQFGGNTAFTVTTQAVVGGTGVAPQVATAASTALNTANYTVDSATADNGASVPGTPVVAGAFSGFTAGGTGLETIAFQNALGTTNVTLSGIANANAGNATTLTQALQTLNTALSGTGISAVQNAAGTGVSFQSSSSFNINLTAEAADAGGPGTGNLFGTATATVNQDVGAVAVTGPSNTASNTGNAIAALTALTQAITNLGLTQGIVGAGENKLNYATNLAQSQITNFSAAESGIKDANIAQEAANLTKAQVLQQTSLAALSQANTSPQNLLVLLKSF
jgi:flagellin